MSVSGKAFEVLLFLASRSGSEFSGYEMTRGLGISSGTLYPILVKLKQQGLVSDRWEEGDPSNLGRPRRRYYRIVGSGTKIVEQRMRALDPGYKPSWGTSGTPKPALG